MVTKNKDGNLVNLVNATESQLDHIEKDNNFGLDTRKSIQLKLRIR